MRKPSEKEHDDTSIPKIHERFEELIKKPRTTLFKTALLAIKDVQEKLKALLEDDKKRQNSNNDLKKKREKLPILTQKKTKN